MSSIVTLPNGKFKCVVRRKGHSTKTRTFDKRTEADAWGRMVEGRIVEGKRFEYSALRKQTVGHILNLYRELELPKRRGWRWESNRIKVFLEEPFALLDLSQEDDIAAALQRWRDRRLRRVSAATVNRDMNVIGSAFKWARDERHTKLQVNPISLIGRPAQPKGGRRRVWSEQELQVWLDHFKFDPQRKPKTAADFIPWVLIIARRTGLRLGEVCGIDTGVGRMPKDTHRGYIDLSVPEVYLPRTKNGDEFWCPLRKDAVEVIKQLLAHRPGEERLIPFGEGTMGQIYRDVRRKHIAPEHPAMADLVIHSLRHTYTTEMVSRVSDPKALLAITGRRSMASLLHYYHPKTADLAKMMG